jgi:TPR repeat protein
MYEFGTGVTADIAQSTVLYRAAAEQGLADACYVLGWRYDHGHGLPESDLEAAAWYRAAADQDIPHAKLQLGVLYERGDGLPQNDAVAAQLYLDASEQGLDWAQYFLGQMYRRGAGVPYDMIAAYAWLNLGASAGNHAAAHERNQLRGKMTKEDIAKAQDLSLRLLKVTPEEALENRQRYLPPGQRKLGSSQASMLQPTDSTRRAIGADDAGKSGKGSSSGSGRSRSSGSGRAPKTPSIPR